jgi:hypothetical protein
MGHSSIQITAESPIAKIDRRSKPTDADYVSYLRRTYAITDNEKQQYANISGVYSCRLPCSNCRLGAGTKRGATAREAQFPK